MSNYPPMFQTPSLDPRIRVRVVRVAGVIYGLIFALGFSAAMWGLDAIQLQKASYHLAWAKFPLGLVITLVISAVAGWLATSSRWSGVGILVWMAAGPLVALVAGHIPYDGLSWVAGLSDPYPTSRVMYPFVLSAAAFTGISMVIGAGIGLVTGLAQMIAVERAWDYSTARHRLGVRSVLVLGLCLPVAILFGLLADFQINVPTRSAILDVARVVETALDPTVDLGVARLPFLESRRSRMTQGYSLYWVDNSDSLETATIDASFGSGLLLRCRQGYGQVFFCSDFDQNLREWMEQLVTYGDVECTNCMVLLDRDMQNWLTSVQPGADQLRDVSLLQHQGGWLYERATFEDGHAVDCRFRSSRPVSIDMCVEAIR